MERGGIRVSSYWTDVLPKKELECKLHQAVRLARTRLKAATDCVVAHIREELRRVG